jgi:hypothetical protein
MDGAGEGGVRGEKSPRGAARYTVHVFGVPQDGSPIAGGLDGITLKAGTAESVSR